MGESSRAREILALREFIRFGKSTTMDYRRFAPIPIRPMLVHPHFLLPQTLSAPNTNLFATCKFQFAPCPESSVRPSFHFAPSFSSPQFPMQ